MVTKLKYIRITGLFGLSFCLFLFNGCGANKDVKIPEYLETSEQVEETTEEADNVEDAVDESAVSEEENQIDFHQHDKWNTLAGKYVNEKGFVDYKGFVKDSLVLNSYLQELAQNHPKESWTINQAKAYWINAYNAFTVKLIVDNYPVKTIKELGGSIYKVNTPWDIKFIKLGDETYDLNNIEHGILRDQYPDPRIHAVVNCASFSCPRLRNEAFTPDKLEEQMTDQMNYFINDTDKNVITKYKAELSSLFKWYSGDFTKDGRTIVAYINEYSDTKIDEDTKIVYKSYDWSLNEQ